VPEVSLSYLFQPLTTIDSSQVVADFLNLVRAVNGNLDADNVMTGSSKPIGSRNFPGTGATLSRADHEHAVQGVEQLSADPTDGLKIGREYFNTVTLQKRMCIGTAGTGTWITTANLEATDVAIHALQHKDGGHDPLGDNTIIDRMKAAGAVVSQGIPSDVAIPSGTWTTVVDLAVTTKNVQLVLVFMRAYFVNSSGANQPVMRLRLLDHTNGDTTIFRSEGTRIGQSTDTNQADVQYMIPYLSPGDGSHTLRMQADASGTGVTVTRPTSADGDNTKDPELKAVIL